MYRPCTCSVCMYLSDNDYHWCHDYISHKIQKSCLIFSTHLHIMLLSGYSAFWSPLSYTGDPSPNWYRWASSPSSSSHSHPQLHSEAWPLWPSWLWEWECWGSTAWNSGWRGRGAVISRLSRGGWEETNQYKMGWDCTGHVESLCLN